jgi:hypothetical protein
MCFSGRASFVVGDVLTGVGGGSIAQNSSTPYRMLAAVPLVFAAQQASKGFVWLTIGRNASAGNQRIPGIRVDWLADVFPSALMMIVERDPT